MFGSFTNNAQLTRSPDNVCLEICSDCVSYYKFQHLNCAYCYVLLLMRLFTLLTNLQWWNWYFILVLQTILHTSHINNLLSEGIPRIANMNQQHQPPTHYCKGLISLNRRLPGFKFQPGPPTALKTGLGSSSIGPPGDERIYPPWN